ncbi:DUF732 domain-containing protein [Mycolicibacter arupensis]|jgi:hypothetical protein|uniref:DUF732 domain-containing protein n=1 Tax=Mycolicibacter arupensis TaxID=342002 RepID=UPI00122CCE5F|nr:DUF732 domain-containing protein [Mycolicibacter arupensis]KAA1428583.1 DUF732 domain-containing protein [Mycolicibacter arupensis]
MGRLALVTAVALGLLLGTAGAAHADDQGFLQELADGNPFRTDAQRIGNGYQVCTMIKTGTPPPVVAASYTFDLDGWRWVNAAQHNLCPDTL